MLPAPAIIHVILVHISLALKQQAAVCTHWITVNDKTQKPFRSVPDKKEHKKHFPLLHGVNVLVIHVPYAEPGTMSHKYASKQVYCQEASQRYVSVVYYLHQHVLTNFQFAKLINIIELRKRLRRILRLQSFA